jgi:hypothetical protein
MNTFLGTLNRNLDRNSMEECLSAGLYFAMMGALPNYSRDAANAVQKAFPAILDLLVNDQRELDMRDRARIFIAEVEQFVGGFGAIRTMGGLPDSRKEDCQCPGQSST